MNLTTPFRCAISIVLLTTSPTFAQVFTGVNSPGGFQDFPFTTGAGATNLAITIPGSPTAFSHLLLKAGATPSDTNYDFIALADGTTNVINLELPEFKITNYVLRVITPPASVTHSFTATVLTNVVDMRATNRPATKSHLFTNVSGVLTAGSWHVFRVDIPTNLPGWRIILDSTNTNPDLYVRRDQPPTLTSWLKRSQSQTNDSLAFAPEEAQQGAYFIAVYQPTGSNSYTLRAESLSFAALTWDPGLTLSGTEVYTSSGTSGGDYYFKITPQNTALGAWRTALNVLGGEANVYLSKGTAPTVASNSFKSERVGSDGFVLPSAAFNEGEDWYYLVHAEPGSQWTLVTGEPFATDLGTVASEGSSGSGDVLMGAEGMRFFKTTVPVNTVAWRLWLANGSTNSILIKQTAVPVLGSSDLAQTGQMLVVPNYLVGGHLYFVGIAGSPGSTINLDSRQQAFTDIPFAVSTNLTISGFGYATFRLQVPVNQLAWQVNVVVSNGNPNVAVRRNLVPNESNNDAYSEVPGSVTDSILIVPPTLSDGTFYITVYGTNSYSCILQSGNPEVTDINFASATTNTDTNRVGWRLFKVSDISQQLGSLGWDLFLTNFAPGTRIALRRNAAPGIWNYRSPGSSSAGFYDVLSTADFLQRPGQPADIWYVGIYNPNIALGNFTLITRALTAEPVPLDGGSVSRNAVPAGKWQFFSVTVPASAALVGWDLRLTNVTSGSPQLVVRREALPTSLSSIGLFDPVTATNWPTGYQWFPASDWTGRNFSPDGTQDQSGRILTVGYGRPLEPGTYYIGVIGSASSTIDMAYTVSTRGIGSGYSIPVKDLDFAGGSITNLGLGARDLAVYRVLITNDTTSWKVKLKTTSGEALLAIAKDLMPNINAAIGGTVVNTFTAGKKMQRSGSEHFVELPLTGSTKLFPGTYYLVVVSEGLTAQSNPNRIGSGSSDYVLQSIGLMPETDLGTLNTSDIVYPSTLEGGESTALHFHNLFDTLGFELSLSDRVGNPVMVSRATLELANPGGSKPGPPGPDPYGNEGGQDNFLVASPDIIDVADPGLDETIMVKARNSGADYPDASYTLHIRKLTAEPLVFDGGCSNVINQTNLYQFYRVDVPPEALGWDVRLTNVTAGSPRLIINRGALALNLVTPGWQPGADKYWTNGGSWIASSDWTQRSFSPDGLVNEDGRILAMGMGQPLQPGTYYVGIYNPAAPTPVSYTVCSRGIGDGFLIPVLNLPFAGGTITNSSLPAREAAYYRVVVPAGASSWQAKLTALTNESMLVLLTNYVPNVWSGRSGTLGKSMQKTGNEHYLSLPSSPVLNLPAGTNYLAVVSEGATATNLPTRIGAGNSGFFIESRGELPIMNLGTAGSTDLVHAATLEGGEVRAYQFTVPPGITSLQAQLTTQTGNPAMVLRLGSSLPYPGLSSVLGGLGSVGVDNYGNEGGYTITTPFGEANNSLISVANPTNGIYTILVKARGPTGVYPNSSYTLVVRALTFSVVDFDGGSSVITNQPANTWKYFRVDVPATALGWDVRLINVATSSVPTMIVRRDLVPNGTTTGPWGTPSLSTNWPSTNQWAAGSDWTRRTFAADGIVNQNGQVLAMGMGQPLEPGTYYIGVINSAGANPMSYTILSRGIGNGLSLPVTDLSFAGGVITNSSLAPRQAAYYRVVIPTNTPNWKIKLETGSGEAMLLILKDHVPSVDCGRSGSQLSGKFMQKPGNEHYVLLPGNSQTNVAAGVYYLAVVGEGLNPANSARIGMNSTAYTLSSLGTLSISNLGSLGPANLVTPDSLEGGDSRFFQFSVLPNTAAIEVRLENRVGIPMLSLVPSVTLPDPGGATTGSLDTYGNDGGVVPNDVNSNIITVVNPTAAVFTVAVKARGNDSGIYPDADYVLRVLQLPAPQLNFTAVFNTNGLNNVASGLLLDNERTYYKVVVPDNVQGSPVLGWELNVAQLSGLATVRARKDLLPSDTFFAGMLATPNAAILVPPFLTSGTWYVEVRGNNSTAFTLTSSAVALRRPAWQMPATGQPPTTPGLSPPFFADSGVDTNGVPLPGDQGVDLQQGQYHFYAISVPPDNAGLCRLQLDAISGNSDLYLRLNLPPTFSHAVSGGAGTILDRSVTGTVTEYANWVPVNGKVETRLTPGTWYLAVRAVNNANARYRLRISTGNIQDLDLTAGSATNQAVAGGDWRYYRLQLPSDMPPNWFVTFSQQAGDVVMHVRDTVPPGNGVSSSDYKDWASDAKNEGPYANYDLPGTYNFTVPPVRPGAAYYLGFRAKVDSLFSVSSSVSGLSNSVPIIPFYGGAVTSTIPAFGLVAFEIVTPSDALRWRHTSIHSNSVAVYIENGTYPTRSSLDDFRSTTANSSQDRFLTTYPWLPNQSYFLVATNTTASPMFFTFNLSGSNTNADDDADGMKDAWEVKYFNSLSQSPVGDSDGDGVLNLNEFLEGTDPINPNLFKPRLTVLATNGVVNVNPLATNYVMGTTVELSALPNSGFLFLGWSGSVTSSANPLSLTMNSHKTIIPRFRVPADDFVQRITLSGPFATSSGLKNAGATKEPGEPNHAGNFGGASLWWSWTAPTSGTVTLTTSGTDFRNALAVYTGSTVATLSIVTNNLSGAGTNTSQVSFVAIAGTPYQIAVDGYNGATGTVALTLSMPGAVASINPGRASNGWFQFTIRSAPGQVLRVEATTNLVAWTSLATVTNVTGTYLFNDTNSLSFVARFYRVVIPGVGPTILTLKGASLGTNGHLQFTVIGATDQVFRIEAGTNLVNWTTIATLTNTGGASLFADPAVSGFNRRFYRAVLP